MTVDTGLFPWARGLPEREIRQFRQELEDALRYAAQNPDQADEAYQRVQEMIAGWEHRAQTLTGPVVDGAAGGASGGTAGSPADAARAGGGQRRSHRHTAVRSSS